MPLRASLAGVLVVHMARMIFSPHGRKGVALDSADRGIVGRPSQGRQPRPHARGPSGTGRECAPRAMWHPATRGSRHRRRSALRLSRSRGRSICHSVRAAPIRPDPAEALRPAARACDKCRASDRLLTSLAGDARVAGVTCPSASEGGACSAFACGCCTKPAENRRSPLAEARTRAAVPHDVAADGPFARDAMAVLGAHP